MNQYLPLMIADLEQRRDKLTLAIEVLREMHAPDAGTGLERTNERTNERNGHQRARRVVRRPTRRAVPDQAVKATPAKATRANGESKSGLYRAAIVKFLSHYSLAPHHSADTTVLRREVAKACGVDVKKDESFPGDVSNALHTLKAAGTIERSGQVWALVKKPEA